MAIFNRNKGDNGKNGTAPEGENGSENTEVVEAFSPEKARRFFDRAGTVHDSGNYEYAMQLWLSGLRQDPSSDTGLDGFMNSVNAYRAETGKKVVSKETTNVVSGKTPVDRYIGALLQFGLKQEELGPATRAADAAAALGLYDPAEKIGRVALKIARTEKRQRKDVYVKLLDVFEKARAFTLAAEAGETACRMDPADGELQNRVRNMMAQATMNKGGFDETGQEGGFRKNIRNAEKQRDLELADQVSKTEDAKTRLLQLAAAEFKESPDDLAVLDKYGKALLDRGRPEDEKRAIALYMQAYEKSGQFRFRQRAGEIQVRRGRRQVSSLRAKVQAEPENKELAAKLAKGEEALANIELNELKLRVENYPTDATLRFELGKKYFDVGKWDEAIESLQQARGDSRNRASVENYLGRALLALDGWEAEAIDTFRGALQHVEDKKGELGLEIRYGLMAAMQGKGDRDGDLEALEEADRLAGQIAIEKFGYRDVKERREAIKKRIAEIRG